jgi:hypothetical protein
MMTARPAPIPAERLRIVPANEASWDDLVAIFDTSDYPSRCLCQRSGGSVPFRTLSFRPGRLHVACEEGPDEQHR